MNIATLIISAMVLTGSVSVDNGGKNRPVVSIDAGVAPTDIKQLITARRTELQVNLRAAYLLASKERGVKIEVTKILWATSVVSSTMDAAMVLLDVAGEQVGLFFMYREGEWRAIPEDFK